MKKEEKHHWMTVDKIDPDKYWNRKIIGRGDIITEFNSQVPVIGENSQCGDPTVPEVKQRYSQTGVVNLGWKC